METKKEVIKDVKKITDFIETFSFRKGGVHNDKDIDMIKKFVKQTLLVKYSITNAV